MEVLAEVLAAGTAVLRLPRALRRSGCTARQHAQVAGPHLPVVLVHGYAGTEAVWGPLLAELDRRGFGEVVSVAYNSFAVDVPDVTSCIADCVRRAVDRAGATGVHLVGHSLGGLLLRRAVADHGLWASTRSAVTIATPHGGSRLARYAPGNCARLMRPGTAPVSHAPPAVAGPRWLSLYSDADRVVPPWSARLTDVGLRADNVLVPGRGHLTICRDRGLLERLVDHLQHSERPAAPVLALAA
jgi:pimeloyl-ACP methyl ester carboxylesterase